MAALSARAIAKRIGYSPGTLYNVFRNLDDLLYTIQVALAEEALAQLRAVPAGAGGAHVRALAHCYMDFALKNRRLWNLLFQHAPPAGKMDHEALARILASMTGVIRDALGPIMEGRPGGDVDQAAHTIWLSLHGMSAMAVNDKMITTPAAAISASALTLVDGVLALLDRAR